MKLQSLVRGRTSGLRGAAAALLVSAAALLGVPGQAGANDVLRVRLGSDVISFDPHRPSTIENTTVSVHLFDGLFGYNLDDMSLENRLAESYEISDDGLVYTITLRQGVQFHGGYGEMTADDVVFSFARVVDPDTPSPWAGEFRGVEVEKVDDYTVRLTLPEPNANFLHAMAGRNQGLILSQRAIEEMGEDWVTRPIGTGPFQFVSWRPGDRTVMEANPDYFRGASPIERVEFILIPEETSAEIALLNREIDVFFSLTSPEVIDRLRGREDIRLDEQDSLMSCHLVLNPAFPPLDNLKVRQAMMHAIDRRDGLIEGFFRGNVGFTHTTLTPAYVEYTDDVPYYAYDPDKARALLAEAGYPDGFDFRYITVALSPFDQFPVVVADDLRRVGIRVELTVMERASYGAARAGGNIPSATTCSSNSPSPDTLLRALVHSDGFPPGVNTARYSGADELLDRARATLDFDERVALYHEAQRQIMTDLPTIPLYANRLFTATHAGVDGVKTSASFWLDTYGATISR